MAESGTYDQATILRRQKLAEAMLSDAMAPQKIQHWAQGLAQLGRAGIAGYMGYKANEDAKALKAQDTAALATLLGGGSPTPTAVAPATAPSGDSPYSNAIAGIESGGAYDKLGPETKGDRAYGKYQVMGANVPEWTQAALGKSMTPQEFLASPDAQEAVFKHRFGQYVDKYGPEGAAKAWFAGEKGMKNPNARDVLGTSVSAYADKFNRALGPQPYQVAGPPTAAPQAPPAALQANPVAAAMGGQSSGGLLANATPQQRAAILAGINASEGSPARAIATAMLGNLTKGDAPTDEIKEYNLAKSQGFNGSFVDFKTAIKKAGATNVTTNVEKGENAFAAEAGKAQAKRYDEIASEGQTAKQMVSDVQTLSELGKTIGTGKGAEAKAALGPYAEALGIKIDGLNEIQAFEAIVNRVAPSLRVKGSGAQSDYELKNFLKSLPNLGNTPEGNAIAAKTIEGLYNNKIAASEIASKALAREITPAQADKMIRELPDPMADYRELLKKNREAPKPAAPAKTAPALPQPGEVRDGWRFKGGNPGDKANWEQVN